MLALGIVQIIAGATAIAVPVVASLAAVAVFVAVLIFIVGALTLAVIIAVLLIAEGSLRVIFAAVVRPAAECGWLAAAGIESNIVGAILLLGWPLTALWVTGLLLGINLTFSGATNAAVAIAARRSLSPASP
jgi:uncharacterized membrane protein HdeD (DUF308 family)